MKLYCIWVIFSRISIIVFDYEQHDEENEHEPIIKSHSEEKECREKDGKDSKTSSGYQNLLENNQKDQCQTDPNNENNRVKEKSGSYLTLFFGFIYNTKGNMALRAAFIHAAGDLILSFSVLLAAIIIVLKVSQSYYRF